MREAWSTKLGPGRLGRITHHVSRTTNLHHHIQSQRQHFECVWLATNNLTIDHQIHRIGQLKIDAASRHSRDERMLHVRTAEDLGKRHGEVPTSDGADARY